MAKVVLIEPPLSLQKRYGKFAAFGSTLPAYGLLILASVIKKSGHSVDLFHGSLFYNEPEGIISKLSRINPDYVGITATTLSIKSASSLANIIKRDLPQTKVIIGGCHISAIPRQTLLEFPDFDIGVIGEGEETFPELINAMENKKSLYDVDGIVFRGTADIILTKSRRPIHNLDDIPFPDWDILTGFPQLYHPAIHKVKRLPATYILTSRGCPNQCSFCDRSVFGRQCRFFSQVYILNMVEMLYCKFGVREISIEDDTFLINKKRLIGFCEQLIKSKISISWTCNGRVDAVEPGILKLMKRAGCWQIGFGIENGDQQILNSCHKNITLDKIRRAIDLTRSVGLNAKGFFILGFPYETEKSLGTTIDFAKSLKLTDITVSFMTPFPGSELYSEANKFGKFIKDWSKMNILNTVFIPNDLNEEKLRFYHKKMLREFYFRIGIILHYFKRMIFNFYLMKNLLQNLPKIVKSILIDK